MDHANVAILIVAYKSQKSLPRVMEALDQQTVRPARVRVLENGSPDGERIDPGSLPDWVEFVESDENLGFAAGNNLLARDLTEDWLICLNPDAFPDPDWLEQLMSGAQRFTEFDLFGSTQWAHEQPGVLDGAGDVYHFSGQPYRGAYGRRFPVPDDGEVFAPCGAALMIRRAVFEALQGYDEDFFCYCEDVDLAYRARLNGHRCVQLQAAQVSHMGYGSSARRSDFVTYHGVRNRLWTFIKNTPLPLIILMAPFHAALTIILWVSSARFGQFSVFTKGLRDGFAAWPRLMGKRRDIQKKRQIKPLELARMISWNPRAIFTRQPDVRRIR